MGKKQSCLLKRCNRNLSPICLPPRITALSRHAAICQWGNNNHLHGAPRCEQREEARQLFGGGISSNFKAPTALICAHCIPPAPQTSLPNGRCCSLEHRDGEIGPYPVWGRGTDWNFIQNETRLFEWELEILVQMPFPWGLERRKFLGRRRKEVKDKNCFSKGEEGAVRKSSLPKSSFPSLTPLRKSVERTQESWSSIETVKCPSPLSKQILVCDSALRV